MIHITSMHGGRFSHAPVNVATSVPEDGFGEKTA
jgi:hypothetical protein